MSFRASPLTSADARYQPLRRSRPHVHNTSPLKSSAAANPQTRHGSGVPAGTPQRVASPSPGAAAEEDGAAASFDAAAPTLAPGAMASQRAVRPASATPAAPTPTTRTLPFDAAPAPVPSTVAVGAAVLRPKSAALRDACRSFARVPSLAEPPRRFDASGPTARLRRPTSATPTPSTSAFGAAVAGPSFFFDSSFTASAAVGSRGASPALVAPARTAFAPFFASPNDGCSRAAAIAAAASAEVALAGGGGAVRAGPSPAALHASLAAALARLAPDDGVRRLAAHRAALADFIDARPDPTEAAFLRACAAALEGAALAGFGAEFAAQRARADAAEAAAEDARARLRDAHRAAAALKLDADNARRALRGRDELLAQISATHKINVSMANWITGSQGRAAAAATAGAGGNGGGGGGGASDAGSPSATAAERPPQRTMAEIRAVQRRVAAACADARRRSEAGRDGVSTLSSQAFFDEEMRREIDDVEIADAARSGLTELDGVAARERTSTSMAAPWNGALLGASVRSPMSPGSPFAGDATAAGVSLPLVFERPPVPFAATTADRYRQSGRLENIGVVLEASAVEGSPSSAGRGFDWDERESVA